MELVCIPQRHLQKWSGLQFSAWYRWPLYFITCSLIKKGYCLLLVHLLTKTFRSNNSFSQNCHTENDFLTVLNLSFYIKTIWIKLIVSVDYLNYIPFHFYKTILLRKTFLSWQIDAIFVTTLYFVNWLTVRLAYLKIPILRSLSDCRLNPD